jgi:hypothetical protein
MSEDIGKDEKSMRRMKINEKILNLRHKIGLN